MQISLHPQRCGSEPAAEHRDALLQADLPPELHSAPPLDAQDAKFPDCTSDMHDPCSDVLMSDDGSSAYSPIGLNAFAPFPSGEWDLPLENEHSLALNGDKWPDMSPPSDEAHNWNTMNNWYLTDASTAQTKVKGMQTLLSNISEKFQHRL